MIDNTLFEKFCEAYNADMGVYYCGKRIGTKNHVYGPEIRNHFLIVLVEKGRAILYGSDKKAEFGDKAMLVMFPGEKIFYTAQSEWTIKWIGIAGTGIEEIFAKIGITRKNPIYYPKNYHNLSEIFSEIYELDYNAAYSAKFKAQSLLYEFFSECFAEKDLKNTDITTSAVRIMEYNYDKPLTINQISDDFFLEPSYFSRLFKKEVGITPKKYILQLRIKRAMELLKNTDYKINEISNMVGFEDPLYFSRMFKKETGTAPGEYRNKYTNM